MTTAKPLEILRSRSYLEERQIPSIFPDRGRLIYILLHNAISFQGLREALLDVISFCLGNSHSSQFSFTVLSSIFLTIISFSNYAVYHSFLLGAQIVRETAWMKFQFSVLFIDNLSNNFTYVVLVVSLSEVLCISDLYN